MRSEKDLIQVQVDVRATVEFDLQRMIEDDPVWRTIASKYNLEDEAQQREALREYVEYYVVRERFLSRLPATNGPGSLRITSMEVRFYGDHGINAAEEQPGGEHSHVAAKDQG